MELSPKQQTVELIKKSDRILILGHKNPEGDMVGSLLALGQALKSLEKTPEVIISDDIPGNLQFLPTLDTITKNYQAIEGKIIRVDTKKIPVAGMKVQKSDDHLDIILDADKNLKFEFLNILNGLPKPDLIIVLDTADVEKIDKAYDENTELFFETPVVNIDHHAGNEYFGSVNLVDLTATSTAEILVSLFEALGVKISDPDIATCLLAGITVDTQSFRAQNTTPKSLTVAAQLLANGARQQEIVSNLYKMRPMALMKLWGKMLSGIKEDKNHRFAWSKIKLSDTKGVSKDDVFEAADELLANTPDADVLLILCETEKDKVAGKLKGAKDSNVLEIAELFGGEGTAREAEFEISGKSLSDTELWVLKKLFDFWGESAPGPSAEKRQLWDVIEKEATTEISDKEPLRQAQGKQDTKEDNKKESVENHYIESKKPHHEEEKPEGNGYIELKKAKETKPDYAMSSNDADAIESALKSLTKEEESAEKSDGFASLKEVIDKKKSPAPDDDVFEEE